MENHNNKFELIELYKLHAELADRVSQRRESANRLFVSLLTGIFILFATFLRFGTNEIPASIIMVTTGLLGTVLSTAWFIVIRSHQQLNSGKFAALYELENKLVYPFFRREWEILKNGNDPKKYWELTIVETALPYIFGLFFVVLVIVSFFI